MDFDNIKKALQEHLGDGLAVVVGSGLSCAEGLPGMGALERHLQSVLPGRLDASTKDEWFRIQPLISKVGLEAALMQEEPSVELEAAIAPAVVEAIEPDELRVISEAISGSRTLRFTRLLKHLLKPDEGIPILTTNYDRLIEVACESIQLPVDTMFDGGALGWHDEKEARLNLLRAAGLHGRFVRKRLRKHVRLFKPHGSLDWYETPNGPIRFQGSIEGVRLIITPGRKKLRRGYDTPFDVQREKANRLLDEASRFLVIGYGFNDDHLETRLTGRIKEGVRTLILTRGLSLPAKTLVTQHSSVVAIERKDDRSSRIYINDNLVDIPVPELWDVGGFITEVLEP